VSGRALSEEERAAGAIVAQQLGGHEIERDGQRGSHDFDVELPDGRTIALEVTSAADEAMEALSREALHKVREEPTLRQSWWIGLPRDRSLRVDPLMARVVPLLEVLERHGVTEVSRYPRPDPRVSRDDGSEAAQAVRGVLELGALHAHAIGPPPPGEAARVMASLAGGAGSDFGSLNELVAECARKKAPKLIAAEGDARHLFVWLRGSAADAQLAVTTLPPPESTPEIPEGIDVVWLAPGIPGQPFSRLLRLEPSGGWETISAGVGPPPA
jgi:hypothetical protein